MGSRGSVMWLLEALLGRGIPAVARGVAGSVEIDAPLGLELPFAIAPLGEIQHKGLQFVVVLVSAALPAAAGS